MEGSVLYLANWSEKVLERGYRIEIKVAHCINSGIGKITIYY